MTIQDFHRGLMVFATIILVFATAVLLAYGYNLINFPYDYDQGEGFELVDTLLFSEFQYPYQDTEAYPFYSSNYPPVYHLMAVPFAWQFGAGYWYGRLLSLIATLIASLVISYAVYRETDHRWISALSGFAFLSSNTIYHIAPLFRQHIVMVMFEVIAVVILAHAIPKKKNNQILCGLLLVIVAGYTKQLAAVTAIAVLGWMVLRNPHRALIWTVRFALIGGLIFLWLTIDTNGEWWRQAILANVNKFDPYQTFGLTLLWLRLHALLIVPAMLLVLYELYFDRLSLYSVWFLVATVFGAFGSGTWGAGDSYFATSIAGLCILSGIFFGRTASQLWQNRQGLKYSALVKPIQQSVSVLTSTMLILIPIAYFGYGVMTFKMPTQGVFFGAVANFLSIEPNVMDRHFDSATYDTSGYANIGHFVTQADIDSGDYIVELMNQTTRPILSEEAGFSIAANRDVITNPTQLRNLWLNGLWDGTGLISQVDNKAFGLIIFRAQFYPDPFLEAVGRNYVVEETVFMNGFDYWILYPLE